MSKETLLTRSREAPDDRNAVVRPRVSVWAIAVVAMLASAALKFWYFYLDDVAHGDQHTWPVRAIEEGTGAIAGVPLIVAVVAFFERFPLDRPGWKQRLPAHVAAMVVTSVLHTTLNLVLRRASFALFDLGSYDYGRMSVRYLMELPNDAISYATILAVILGVRYYAALRDREVQAAELQRGLVEAQLRNLRLQLQPHFLFNALNTISSTMYEDPVAADTMIGQLSELLRHSLRTARTAEVSLEEELDVLAQYVGLMRARFGEGLQLRLDIDPAARSAAVPTFLLQPLVENAARHGNLARIGRGIVIVRASVSGGFLTLDVEDDGPGLAAGVDWRRAGGVGLGGTADRLRLLHGDAHRFEVGNLEDGGFRVRMVFPARAPAPVSDSRPIGEVPEDASAHR